MEGTSHSNDSSLNFVVPSNKSDRIDDDCCEESGVGQVVPAGSYIQLARAKLRTQVLLVLASLWLSSSCRCSYNNKVLFVLVR